MMDPNRTATLPRGRTVPRTPSAQRSYVEADRRERPNGAQHGCQPLVGRKVFVYCLIARHHMPEHEPLADASKHHEPPSGRLRNLPS